MSDGGGIFEFGQFRVDALRRSLEHEGQSVALSCKAFEILVVLLKQRGEIVDKDALMRQVWPDTAVEENNITVAISALRKALELFRGTNFETPGIRDPSTPDRAPAIAGSSGELIVRISSLFSKRDNLFRLRDLISGTISFW